VSFVLAILCIGIILRKRSLLTPDFLADGLFADIRYHPLDLQLHRRPGRDQGGAIAVRAVPVAAVDYSQAGSRRTRVRRGQDSHDLDPAAPPQ